jgi:hypothetical protein
VLAESNTTCGNDKFADATFCNTTVPLQALPAVAFYVDYARSIFVNISGPAPPVQFSWSPTPPSQQGQGGRNATLLWDSSSQYVVAQNIMLTLPYGHPAVFGAFTAMKLDKDVLGSFKPQGPSQVHQCMLTYCLRTYEGIQVRNGVTHVGPVNGKPMTISSHAVKQTKVGWDLHMQFNMSASINGTVANFTMNYFDYLNIGSYMQDVLHSSVIYGDGGTLTPGNGGKMVPSFGLAMYKSDNITAMMDNIADSMTNSMRTSQKNLTTVRGTALVNETYLQIEWKWLTLPVMVAVLSLVLLIIVMARTHSRGVEGQYQICHRTGARIGC